MRLTTTAILILVGAAPHAPAQTFTWTQPLVGRWNQAACWTPAVVPNGEAAIAVFPSIGPVQIDVEATASIGTLRLDNPEARIFLNNGSLVISAGGSINGAIYPRNRSLSLNPTTPGAIALDGSGLIRLTSPPAKPDSVLGGNLFVAPGSVATLGEQLLVHGTGGMVGDFILLGTVETDPGPLSQIWLRGTFDNPDGGGLIRANDGEVYVMGTVRRIPVHSTINGRVVLSTGTLERTTVTGNVLSNDGVLRDSTVHGWVRVGGDARFSTLTGTKLVLDGSNQVNGTFDLLSAEKNDIPAELIAPIDTTLEGVATLRLFAPASNPSLARIVASPNATLTIGSGIITRGTGEFRGNVRLAGTIELGSADVLRVREGTLTRAESGSIRPGAGSISLLSSVIDGFDLDLSDSTGITLERIGPTEGPSILRRSTILGHVESRSGNSTLEATSITGDLEVTGGTATLLNAGPIKGPIVVGNRYGFASGEPRLVVDDASGRILSNEIRLRPATATVANATLASAAGQTTTLGREARIRGSGTITGAWNIQGAVIADQSLPLTIETATVTAEPGGLLSADGGDLVIQRSTVDGVAIRAVGAHRVLINQPISGSTFPPLRLRNVSITGSTLVSGRTASFENVRIDGPLSVLGYATLQVIGTAFDVSDTLDVGNALGPGPAILFDAPIRLDRPALIRLRTQLNSTPPFASLNAALGTEITLGPDVTIQGKGRLIGRFRVEGTLAPEAGSTTVTNIVNAPPNRAPNLPEPAADLVLAPSAVVELDVRSATASDQITGSGMRLDGTLRLRLDPSYVPQPATRHLVIRGGTTQTTLPGIVGTFSRIEASGDFIALTIYSNTRVEVQFLRRCAADLDRNGTVDDADLPPFLHSFALVGCADTAMPLACQADLNADGMVNEIDFYLFVAAYDTMLCPPAPASNAAPEMDFVRPF